MIKVKSVLLTLLAVLHSVLASAQTISGIVVDARTLKPIVAASVFIANATIGTTSDNLGNFTLRNVAADNCTLVVSCVGYKAFVKLVEVRKASLPIKISLEEKTTELAEVVVIPADKNGWLHWGDVFLKAFFGQSAYARECRLRNPEVLTFRLDAKHNLLNVSSEKPLIVENNALGYIVSYDLHEFTYDLTDHSIAYSGYPLFSPMGARNENMSLKFRRNREEVFRFSLLHFMRSLYANDLAKQGFTIVREIKHVQTHMTASDGLARMYDGSGAYDTIYEISNKETLVKVIATKKSSMGDDDRVSADPASISNILSHRDGTAVLNFPDTIQIIYEKGKTPSEYILSENSNHATNLSGLSLVNGQSVTVLANGNYFPSSALRLSGFWAWWEKIAIMLPFDY